MKNLIVILVLSLSTFCFGQSLSDTINFESFNPYIVNNQVLKSINDERFMYGFDTLENDTISMFVAKYHTEYVTKYGEESEEHDKELSHYLYGNSVEVFTNYNTPLIRFFSLSVALKRFCPNREIKVSSFITEQSKFFSFGKKPNLTYSELADLIIFDLKNSEMKNEIIMDPTNQQKRFGISNDFRVEENGNIRYMYTYVLSLQ